MKQWNNTYKWKVKIGIYKKIEQILNKESLYYSISTRQNLGHKYYKSPVYNDKRTNSTEKELNKETKKDGAEYLR